jgi:membrane-associated phospholipid phosphatase
MGPNRRLSRGLLLTLAALAAIPLAIAFADRPLANFMIRNAHDSRGPYVALTHIVDGLEILASLGLAWSLWAFSRGRAFGAKGQIAARTALALFSALGVKEVLKLAFGRTWPETFTCGNPSFIRDAAFGFTPFHGGAGWASFPSGHETAVCAVAGCLWVLTPRLRPLCLLASFLVALGLQVADYHWLSDIVAGVLVGWTLGVFVARLDLSQPAPAC